MNTNFDVSLRRLNSVLKYLRSQPPLLSEYQRILPEQFATGVLEEAPESPEGSITHYLPGVTLECCFYQEEDCTRRFFTRP